MGEKAAIKIKKDGQWVAVPMLQTEGGSSAAGEDGGYYTPSVTSAGLLSWAASKSDMPAVASVNIKGPKGDTGATGATGPAGYTPVKGTDYYTDADKAEMVNAVVAALPKYTGEVEAV